MAREVSAYIYTIPLTCRAAAGTAAVTNNKNHFNIIFFLLQFHL